MMQLLTVEWWTPERVELGLPGGSRKEGPGEAVESILLMPPVSYLHLLGTVVNFAIKYFKKTPGS